METLQKSNFINISDLCDKILLPDEIKSQILNFDSEFDYQANEDALKMLNWPDKWDTGLSILNNRVKSDPFGMKILTVMLHNSTITFNKLLSFGISEEILISTFKAFTRFIYEHKESYGNFAFDRAFWTPRQASGRLFRIGELEYELVDKPLKDFPSKNFYISMHIPSDVVFLPVNVQTSINMARSFFKEFFPKYSTCSFYCESWLLSPNLKEILNKDSNICKFQELFTIVSVNPDARDVFEWVFKNPNINLEDAPQKTSLQKSMKSFMLKGGKIGIALGRLN